MFNLLAPANGALIGVTPAALTGNVTDLSGVVRVEIGTGVSAVPSANGDFTLAAPIAEGANTYPLLALDAAGNVTRVLWRFTVSSQAPTVSIYESGDLLPDGKVFARPVTLTFSPATRPRSSPRSSTRSRTPVPKSRPTDRTSSK